MQAKLMGIDFGTGGCKITVMDEAGLVAGTAYTEYPTYYPHPGWSEQDPKDWIDALRRTVKLCLEQCDDRGAGIQALALTASTHNAVLVDSANRVIRPCIMWTDQRSGQQVASLSEKCGDLIFSIGMQWPSPTWTLPQLLWLKENEPDNYGRIAKIYFVKDYVRAALTGEWCTDHIDAQGSLLYDARNRVWSPQLCDLIGLPVQALPPVVPSKAIVGRVSHFGAELSGLPAGIPVVAGCSDTASEDYGAGAVEPGQMIIKLATAGNVNLITGEAKPHRKSFTYPHVPEGRWYSSFATNSCAASFRWLRDTFFSCEKAKCEAEGGNIYRYMDELAKAVPAGAQGLIYHPYLLGERCPYYDPKLRGSFSGMSMAHEKKHFVRAVLEGVAFSLKDCFQIASAMDTPVKEARLIGGGAKSGLWCQIVCDVLGLPVMRPQHDDSSFGGAMLAGVGVGVFESEIAAVKACVKIKEELVPDPANCERYNKLFAVYGEIVQSLRAPYGELFAQVTY